MNRPIQIVEVAPRDGLQNETAVLTPSERADFVRRLEAAGARVHLIGGADVAAELDAKRAINQGCRLAAAL